MTVRTIATSIVALTLVLMTQGTHAQDTPRIEIQMDATRIRSHQELPKLLYIVPWRDTDLVENTGDRKILIPDLFQDYYQPLLPDEDSEANTQD